MRAESKPAPSGQRLSDKALKELTAMVVSGTLAPGMKLPSERVLSARLGVSRVTVRDAIKRLEAKGFVESRPKSGHFVCTVIPLTVRQSIETGVDERLVKFSDIIEIRKVLEDWAVTRASQRPGSGHLAELHECIAIMRDCRQFATDGQFQRYSEADLRFHQVLAAMCGNPIYGHLIHFLSHLISRSITLTRELMPEEFAEQNIELHEAILKAVEKRDAAAARKAMLAHFDFVARHLATA